MASNHGRPNHVPSSAHRKSRWESSTQVASSRTFEKFIDKQKTGKPGNPSQNLLPPLRPFPKAPTAVTNYKWEPTSTVSSNGQGFHPEPGIVPQPSYGFHMLDRRTIVLADGSVRSYFALPPDYHDLPPRFLPPLPMGPDGKGVAPRFPPMSPEGIRINPHQSKRKFEELSSNDFQASSPFWRDIGIQDDKTRIGKFSRVDGPAHKHLRVDPMRLKRAFIHFVKLINESVIERKRFLEVGKRLRCYACRGFSKELPDMHSLIMHTYNYDNSDLNVEHLGLHKALCILMGWNYAKPPDNTRSYQFLHADEALANQEDLIIWPPIVIVHNTNTGKGKEGRMEGLGSKTMDAKIKAMGFPGAKSKSLYGRDGHQGVTLVKFTGNPAGFKEALQLSQYWEREKHGRRDWLRVQQLAMGKDAEQHPDLVRVDRNGEKKRVLYGYLAIASDLCKLDMDSRMKSTIESRRERQNFN